MNVGELFLSLGIRLNGFDAANEAFGTLRRNMFALTAFRFAENIVDGAIKAGRSIGQMSESLGLSVGSVQEWQNATERQGGTLQGFAQGVSTFEKQLRDFAAGRGGKAVTATMNELGISMADARKAVAGPDGMEGALSKVSDRFLQMGNTAERAALARNAFGGRSARQFTAVLGQGSDALERMREHFRELGGELSGKQVSSLQDLSNTVIDLRTAFHGLTNQLVAALVPILKVLVSAITLITQGLALLVPMFEFLGRHTEVVIAGLMALAAAFVALRAAAIVAAAETIIAWVAAAAPFIAMAAAIYLVVAIVQDLIVGFSGGHSVIFDFFSSLWTYAEKSDGVLGKIVHTIDAIVDAARTAYHEILAIANYADLRSAQGRLTKDQSRLGELNSQLTVLQQADEQSRLSGYAYVPGQGVRSNQQIRQSQGELEAQREHYIKRAQEEEKDIAYMSGKYGENEAGVNNNAATGPKEPSTTTVQITNHFNLQQNENPAEFAKRIADETSKTIARALGATTPGGKVRS